MNRLCLPQSWPHSPVPRFAVTANLVSQHFGTRCVAALLGATVMLAGVRADAMEFAFRPFTIMNTETETWVVASGEIRSGDAKRLRQFLADNYKKWAMPGKSGGKASIVLDSPGGDVDEAMQLAQVLREAFVTALAFPPAVCASACFFLYVGAAKRLGYSAGPGGGLAIHRPFFPADVARQMSAKDAQVAHAAAFARARRWLQDQYVPQAIIDKMFSLPSTQAYWLTDNDIHALGFRAPWYEEWLLARCPEYVEAEQRTLATKNGTSAHDEAEHALEDQRKCENRAIVPELIPVLVRYAQESTKGR